MKKQLAFFSLMLLAFNNHAQTTWNTSLNSGASAPKFGLSTNHPLKFYTNNALRITLTGTGLFGIGTADPTSELHVVGKGLFTSDVLTNSSLIIKNNFHIDHTPATLTSPNIISYRAGSGSNPGYVPYTSAYQFRSLCDVNFPYIPPTNPEGPLTNNRVAFGPQTANLYSDLVQISDPGQNAALSFAVMNGDGIIALEPLNGYAGVGGSRALKINPGCPVDVHICEGGGLTTIYNVADVYKGLNVFDNAIKSKPTLNTDAAITVIAKQSNSAQSFNVYGDGRTELRCQGGQLTSGAILDLNEVSGNQAVSLINLSSGAGQSLQNIFNIKANGETTLKANSVAGLALKIKNSTSDVFSLYGNGYTEIRVNNPTAMPSNRVFVIKDVLTPRDLFVVKKDGKVYAREVEISSVANFPDYVFDKNYPLKPIAEVERFITENKRLPGFEKGTHYEENGINVSNLLLKQQEKLEEQMLYIIQLEKRLAALEKNK